MILAELFSRYEQHRDLILDDLLLSIVRLPTSKKSLRCYRLPSGESIQMFTALIMHLIHSPISTKNNELADAGNELQLLSTYSTAQNLAFKFLTLFFRSCGTKQGEDDHRMVFENFLADLLLTANRPEWPASEILLTLLSRILMKNFSNHSLPVQTRLQSLDYLGSVAAQLRKDSIDSHELNSRENRERLDQVVEKVRTSSLDWRGRVTFFSRVDPFELGDGRRDEGSLPNRSIAVSSKFGDLPERIESIRTHQSCKCSSMHSEEVFLEFSSSSPRCFISVSGFEM